jgi:hypothetical protein
MGYKIIRAEDRVASMIDWFTGVCKTITDFVVGSKIRTKFETIAVEMEAQDYAWYQSLKKAIPIALYRAFDFELQPAQAAIGSAVFSIPAPVSVSITIPANTIVGTIASLSAGEVLFKTVVDAIIGIGQTATVDIPVQCTVAGVIGNVALGTITAVKSTVTGASSLAVTNGSAVTGGLEREAEDERRLRFIEYVKTLSKGTPDAVVYGAKTAYLASTNGVITERVQSAVIYEPFLYSLIAPVGKFECYVYNGETGASDELVTEAQKIIDGYRTADNILIPGWKAAGVICGVKKAVTTPVATTATITLLSGGDVVATNTVAEEVIDSYIASLEIGEKLIFNVLVERLMGLPGVYNVAISAPSGDLTPAFNEVYTKGTKTIAVTSL